MQTAEPDNAAEAWVTQARWAAVTWLLSVGALAVAIVLGLDPFQRLIAAVLTTVAVATIGALASWESSSVLRGRTGLRPVLIPLFIVAVFVVLPQVAPRSVSNSLAPSTCLWV